MHTNHGCQDSGRPIVLCLCILITDVRIVVVPLYTTVRMFMYTDHGCQDSGRPIVLCLCILITDVRIVVDP